MQLTQCAVRHLVSARSIAPCQRADDWAVDALLLLPAAAAAAAIEAARLFSARCLGLPTCLPAAAWAVRRIPVQQLACRLCKIKAAGIAPVQLQSVDQHCCGSCTHADRDSVKTKKTSFR
jgi:hypothetical protein